MKTTLHEAALALLKDWDAPDISDETPIAERFDALRIACQQAATPPTAPPLDQYLGCNLQGRLEHILDLILTEANTFAADELRELLEDFIRPMSQARQPATPNQQPATSN